MGKRCLIDFTYTAITSMINSLYCEYYLYLHFYKQIPKTQITFSPFALFLGYLDVLVLPEDDMPLSLMESWAEEALPVASLSRIMLSYPLLPPLW